MPGGLGSEFHTPESVDKYRNIIEGMGGLKNLEMNMLGLRELQKKVANHPTALQDAGFTFTLGDIEKQLQLYQSALQWGKHHQPEQPHTIQ